MKVNKKVNLDQLKVKALMKHLDCDQDEAESAMDDYSVYTDSEADEAAKEYVIENLWAFRASFLSAHMDVPEQAIEAIQSKMYEGASPVLVKMMGEETLEHLINDAILCDGRGHFLSSYDGEETEVNTLDDNGEVQTFYVYQQN